MSYSFDVDKWQKARKDKRIETAKNLKELGEYLKDLGYKLVKK